MSESQRNRLYEQLVERSYACVLDGNAWHGLLEALLPACGRQTAGLFAWDRRGEPLQAGVISQCEPSAIHASRDFHAGADLGREMMAARVVGRWYHDAVESAGEPEHVEAAAMQPPKREHRLREISSLKLYEDEHSGAYLTVHTHAGADRPDAAQQRMLMRLAPHLVRAASLSHQLRRLELGLHQREALLEHAVSPVWLLDGSGYVHYANPAAQRCVQAMDCPLRLQHGRLSLSAARLPLRALLHAATAGMPAAKAGWLPLPGGAGELMVAPLSEAAAANGLDQPPLALLAWPRWQLRPRLLAELFGLTPAESRLALQLARGVSPEQCALRLQLSIHTVRSQMRALFHKTSTSRQPELVARLGRLTGW